jgi:hypothetical protein
MVSFFGFSEKVCDMPYPNQVICRKKNPHAPEQSAQALMICGFGSGKTDISSILHAKQSGILSRGNMTHDSAVLSR